MTEPEFRNLIDSTKKSDPFENAEKPIEKLSKLDEKEIFDFGSILGSIPQEGLLVAPLGRRLPHQWKLFRRRIHRLPIVADPEGEAVYSAALANPDSLAKVRVEPDESDCERYPAPEA